MMKAPELTGFWFDDENLFSAAAHASEHELAQGEQEALDELAERVSAARSVY